MTLEDFLVVLFPQLKCVLYSVQLLTSTSGYLAKPHSGLGYSRFPLLTPDTRFTLTLKKAVNVVAKFNPLKF